MTTTNSHLLSNHIEIGDRVRFRFRTLSAEEWKWGVVKSLQHDNTDDGFADDPDGYSILPWEASEDQTETLIEFARYGPDGRWSP
jgi:hypothetical protein